MSKNRKSSMLFVLLAAAIMISCIDEELVNCRNVSVGFDYSYNILSSNALSEQVSQLSLYVFNERGLLVMKQISPEMGISNNYRIDFSNLDAGKYKFVAWAQSRHVEEEEAFFTIPDLKVGSSVLGDLSYYLKRESGVQQNELNNLLVGYSDVVIENIATTQKIDIQLKKVNKKIRVVLLPYRGGSELDVEDYSFSIVDPIGNGHVNYDYSLINDEQITYRPYYAANVMPDPSEVVSPEEIDRAAVVEFNTSRLVEENNPRLIITSKENDREILSVNLPWFFSLTEMEDHKEWSLQEYLDRQDRYAITFFLDGGSWMQATIIINGWVINDIDVDM